jgi:hypothetical protein
METAKRITGEKPKYSSVLSQQGELIPSKKQILLRCFA